MNKKAFTLAEVLITLSIIGVVAAMTVPNLMSNFEKQKTIVGLKKAYSEFIQVVDRARSQHGDCNTWDFSLSGADFFETYLNNYLIVKEQKRTAVQKSGIKYYQISGKEETGLAIFWLGDSRFVTLPSGAHIMLSTVNYYSSSYGRKGITIDINGFAKPNQLGKDVFSFVLLQENGRVMPHYFDDQEQFKDMPERNKLKDGPSSYQYQCNKNGRGLWCAALIYKDGWKIADDYPW